MKTFFIIAAVLLLTTCACSEDKLYSNVCNLPCYTGPEGTLGVGACKPGVPVCAGNNMLSCEGQVLPEPEYCNQIDDDCDGFVDIDVQDPEVGEPCGYALGICRTGTLQCRYGDIVCMSSIGPTVEVCNGKDDDCNGLVDDIGVIDLCYDGNIQELFFSPCRAGTLQCVDGEEQCMGQVMAEAEICDGMDNNCNGIIDEGLGLLKFDVVFILDRSCSMIDEPYTLSVGSMVHALETTNNDPSYMFAVIGLPVAENINLPDILQTLDTAEATRNLLLRTSWINDTSYEPSYDALQLVTTSSAFQWRKDARKLVFVFTDEPGQSYQYPPLYAADIIPLLTMGNYETHTFYRTANIGSFQDIAAATNGSVQPMQILLDMSAHMQEVWKQECQ